MAYKLILADWNGTVFNQRLDTKQNRRIIRALLRDSLAKATDGHKIQGILETYEIAQVMLEITKNLALYYTGAKVYIHKSFNKRIMKGRPAERLKGIIDQFARDYAYDIDGRMIMPIREAHAHGARTAILSAAWDYSITQVLKEAGYSDVFDEIVANKLRVADGNGGLSLGLTTDIMGRKHEIVEEMFFRKQGFRGNEIVIMGDSYDDATVAPLLPEGHFIVSFCAPDSFKQEMASKHRAFVPENEGDLRRKLMLSD